jgi:hypothetical protein
MIHDRTACYPDRLDSASSQQSGDIVQTMKIEETLEIERDEETTPGPQIAEFDSVAIQRLIDEVVGNDPVIAISGYNRTYNRHNR